MPVLYAVAIALGLALFVLSTVLPEPSIGTTFKILSVISFVLAAVFAILPGFAGP